MRKIPAQSRKRWFYNWQTVEQGQALLIIVLVMVVMLTIGLSLASRTITTVKTTAEEENSQRAFSAAEAGIERTLQNNTPLTGSFSNNASYRTSVTTLAGSTFLINNGNQIFKDDGIDIWLSAYPTYASPWSGRLSVYWGSSDDVCTPNQLTNTMAALEIVVISGTVVAPRTAHFAYDPCPVRRGGNNLDRPGNGAIISGKNFSYDVTLDINSGLLARIIPLYTSTVVGIRADSALPTQGNIIESVGVAGDTQRKITVFKGYPKVPTEFFPYLLFSP